MLPFFYLLFFSLLGWLFFKFMLFRNFKEEGNFDEKVLVFFICGVICFIVGLFLSFDFWYLKILQPFLISILDSQKKYFSYQLSFIFIPTLVILIWILFPWILKYFFMTIIKPFLNKILS